MNKVILVGNLGADVELKVFGDGNSVLNFSVATSETWKDAEGVKQEKTEWHRCKYFTKGATPGVAAYLKKGTKVAVDGSIAYGSYEKEGAKVYTTDIKVSRVELVGSSGGAAKPTTEKSDADEDGLPGSDEIPY